ncbi:LPS export ABC transporter permease LptF [Rivibacter subsaxonicus]|uniref:Lipopolysaccharide export system permease protein LptF n=1 Tax=Rivibacter subsaxonicus TaxID=457575 RepID=A0A4Q7VB70_9BURK|nr:LPS export ABC transporter permease LptF [Rivibacter subsaxonicus]RZT93865.1 lipopolysaccharide export system permease protein [Rivibacter subsaxonicus]
MLFDSTLRRDLSRSFGATLIVILTIVITMFMIRTLGQAAGGSVDPRDVALLLGYITLENLPTMLSLSLFIAVVTTLTRMYRDSEMVIWFASGVSLMRFLRPVLRLAMPVIVIITLLAFVVWPWGNRQVAELKDRYQRRSDLARIAPGQFQTSSDGKRVFFIDKDTGDGSNARNVFLLERNADGESVTSARSGRVVVEGNDRFVELERGQRSELNPVTLERRQASFDSYRAIVGERLVSPNENLPPKALGTIALLLDPTPRHQAELVWRTGLALGAFNLVLLGIGLSAGNPRRASSWNLLYSLLAFVVYFNLLNLSQAWVASGRLGPWTTLLLVHGLTLAGALALLWWRERGTALSLRRRRMPVPAAGDAATPAAR